MVRLCIHGPEEPEPQGLPRPRGPFPGVAPAPAREPGRDARPLLLQVLDELCARGLLRLDAPIPSQPPAPWIDGGQDQDSGSD